ncbi:MAG TPA: hypothetical protein PKV16_03930 [Caldisericia bacterium]|nr:hypothetical protein [Caldisericia bacterium]HPF48459.1 hypothetical protein [Caldisericia bacterium]HPI83361.1 hypothetical protein [Caldisericia bacterium]HPQ92913.1 hypothetical protein [Caldisericia bacterium]HRV73989.1 hypothetical protein [Caldisericia bacterium]
MGKKLNMSEIFNALQEQMMSKLTYSDFLKHPVDRGDNSELEWTNMLSTYLPSRYKVDKATIIDSKGCMSDQIDIVVFDTQYSPFLLKQNGINYLPVESVYAVFEVKQKLSKGYIKYSCDKLESVRKLHRSKGIIKNRNKKICEIQPVYIYGGILAQKGLTNSQKKNIELYSSSYNRNLDFCCSLEDRCLFYDENRILIIGSKGNMLIDFYVRLFSCLQSQGTVAPINIDNYLKDVVL